MKTVLLCATLFAAALSGCAGLFEPKPIDAAKASQIGNLLADADQNLKNSVWSKEQVSHYPLGSEMAGKFAEASQKYLQIATDKSYEAYNLEPAWAPSNKMLALCQAKMGNSDKAIEFAQKAMKYDPTLDDCLQVIATEYTRKAIAATDARTKKNYYAKAIAAYEEYIRRNPDRKNVPYLESTIEYLKEEMAKLK
jgi:tetratricopeptide (TPR) repeat protein